jgi:predicted nucleotidyltransferase
MDTKEIAESNEILRAVVGSTVHGLAIEGTDDRDEMGVFIEPPEYCLGINGSFDNYVYRTQPKGVRSGPGDLDLTIYSLRKYVRLAAQGNPSILTLLFAPPEFKIISSDWGERLLELTPFIVSRQAGHRFLGYLRAQRARMLGERGQARLPNRPELVEKYGYDTKYAGHMVRLGFQGKELLETGRFTLPMPEYQRKICLAIRQGQISKNKALITAAWLEHEISELLDSSKLPEHPDYETINNTLINMHTEYWKL